MLISMLFGENQRTLELPHALARLPGNGNWLKMVLFFVVEPEQADGRTFAEFAR